MSQLGRNSKIKVKRALSGPLSSLWMREAGVDGEEGVDVRMEVHWPGPRDFPGALSFSREALGWVRLVWILEHWDGWAHSLKCSSVTEPCCAMKREVCCSQIPAPKQVRWTCSTLFQNKCVRLASTQWATQSESLGLEPVCSISKAILQSLVGAFFFFHYEAERKWEPGTGGSEPCSLLGSYSPLPTTLPDMCVPCLDPWGKSFSTASSSWRQ